MGIISELSSASGCTESNAEIAQRCVQAPVLLHSVAEGLRTGTSDVRADCLAVLEHVAEMRPELLGNFVHELFETVRRGPATITRRALELIVQLVPAHASTIFAEREFLLELARGGGPRGLIAAKVLAALCASGTNYRGKLALHVLRLLSSLPDRDLHRWAAVVAGAVVGSADGVKRFEQSLAPRLEALDPNTRKRVERVVSQLQRSLAKRR